MHADKKREQILQRIRSVTQRTEPYSEHAFTQLTAKQKQSVSAELRTFADNTDEFTRQATATGSTVVELTSVTDVPGWLESTGFGNKPLALSPQPEICNLDWSHLDVLVGNESAAHVGVVKATLAAAETGSIMQHSHAVSTGLLFLVETLVVVLDRVDIRPRYEDLWAGLPPLTNGTAAPRAVHLISGPSRTADVEQMIQIGAHGPREVYILLVSE